MDTTGTATITEYLSSQKRVRNGEIDVFEKQEIPYRQVY
jgi:hypothetical protein